MSLKSFYEGLFEYEKSTDIETIKARMKCASRNFDREELRDAVENETYKRGLDAECGIVSTRKSWVCRLMTRARRAYDIKDQLAPNPRTRRRSEEEIQYKQKIALVEFE